MEKINDLTVDQFKGLLRESNLEANNRSNLTEEEIKNLAQRLNMKIDIPLLSENTEEKILIKIVTKIDQFLSENLPNEFYDLIRSLDNGIDEKEAKRLVKRLSSLANKKIDIPYIPEAVEHVAIKFIVGLIINAARKRSSLLPE